MDYDMRKGIERRGADRRRGANPSYAGPERRTGSRRGGDRRAPVAREPGSKWPWIFVAAAAFFVWDTVAWDAHYRRHMLYELNQVAGDTRSWSANVWKLG